MEKHIWYAINEPQLLAGTTTRNGGTSTGVYSSFNLAFHTGDNLNVVLANRERFSKIIDVDQNHMVLTYQSHSTILKRVTHKDGGKGKSSFESGIPADALYTTEKNLLIGVFHADCVPVFIHHRHQPLIAIVHAGTPGSLKGITTIVVKELVQTLQINPSDLIAHLGPSLDFAHHPIDEERKNNLLSMNPDFRHIIKKIGGDYFLDIPLLNYLQLVDAGLNPNAIHVSNLDTYSNPKDYFSFDRDQKTGRHISFMVLR